MNKGQLVAVRNLPTRLRWEHGAEGALLLAHSAGAGWVLGVALFHSSLCTFSTSTSKFLPVNEMRYNYVQQSLEASANEGRLLLLLPQH